MVSNGSNPFVVRWGMNSVKRTLSILGLTLLFSNACKKADLICCEVPLVLEVRVSESVTSTCDRPLVLITDAAKANNASSDFQDKYFLLDKLPDSLNKIGQDLELTVVQTSPQGNFSCTTTVLPHLFFVEGHKQ